MTMGHSLFEFRGLGLLGTGCAGVLRHLYNLILLLPLSCAPNCAVPFFWGFSDVYLVLGG